MAQPLIQPIRANRKTRQFHPFLEKIASKFGIPVETIVFSPTLNMIVDIDRFGELKIQQGSGTMQTGANVVHPLLTVPKGKRYRIIDGYVSYTTSAVVATRSIRISSLDPAGQKAHDFGRWQQTASLINEFLFTLDSNVLLPRSNLGAAIISVSQPNIPLDSEITLSMAVGTEKNDDTLSWSFFVEVFDA